MLVEHSTDSGDVVQIVYRNGGLVDANALESLCDKVQQPLVTFNFVAVTRLETQIVVTLVKTQIMCFPAGRLAPQAPDQSPDCSLQQLSH